MSINKNTAKYILIFLGILIFLAAYIFVYMDYTDKTDAVSEEVIRLNDRFEELSAHYDKLEAYKSSIEESRVYIDSTLNKYYSAETPEDFIMFAVAMENTLGVRINALSFTEPMPVYSVTAVKETEDYAVPPETIPLEAYRLSSVLEGTATYSQMKSALDFIYAQPDVTKLDSLNLSYDSSTGLIISSFTLDKYYITGRDIEAHQAAVNYTNLGKSVLMGN